MYILTHFAGAGACGGAAKYGVKKTSKIMAKASDISAFRGYGAERRSLETKAGRTSSSTGRAAVASVPELWITLVEIMATAGVLASVGGKHLQCGYWSRRFLFLSISMLLAASLWLSGSPLTEELVPSFHDARSSVRRALGPCSVWTYRVSVQVSHLVAAWHCLHRLRLGWLGRTIATIAVVVLLQLARQYLPAFVGRHLQRESGVR